MRDILRALERWVADGVPVVLGSVVERVGSAPRDPGAALAVCATGELAGSVTGGCVDPAVIREAKDVLAGGAGRLLTYGLTDEETLGVGLSCGGTIAVAVYALDPELVPPLVDAVAADRPVAVTVSLDEARFGEQRLVFGGDDAARWGLAASARTLLELGESAVVETDDGELVFVEAFAPRPDLYVFGGGDHAAALARLGRFLGYRVTVCDARAMFVTRERFPDADELVAEWPDRFLRGAPVDARTAICLLTHDQKFDVPALHEALATPAGYIGAIGSEKSAREREERLRAEGVGDAELARIHAPIGLALGARSPEEVAIAIGAQLVESSALARAKRTAAVARATVLS
jgi:xanthine dehydrogenase accessory factor